MKGVFSFLFIISISSLFSQTDSLDQKIIGLEGRDLVDKLNELSFAIAQSEPDRAITMAEDAASKALELNFPYRLGNAIPKLSVVYRFQGYYHKAIQYAD